MGAIVQARWGKFWRYWQVEPRMVPMAPGRLLLSGWTSSGWPGGALQAAGALIGGSDGVP